MEESGKRPIDIIRAMNPGSFIPSGQELADILRGKVNNEEKEFYFKIDGLLSVELSRSVYTVSKKPLSSGEKGIGIFVIILARNEDEALQKREYSYGKPFLSLDNFPSTTKNPTG